MSTRSFAPFGLVCREGTPFDAGIVYSAPGGTPLGQATPAVVCIGAFDGLHVGHRALVRHALGRARELGVACVAITFDPDPAELVCAGRAPRRLLSVADRCQGLLSLGVDHVVAFSFTEHLAGMEARDFVDLRLMGLLRPLEVHVGENFRFGRRGTGTVGTLEALGADRGFSVVARPLVEVDGIAVCATRVRDLVGQAGRLDEANRLLGRCHYVRGTVAHGRGEGTSFGFPTANVVCDAGDCMPAEGVYACYLIHDGLGWPAAANVGAPPTFSSPRPAFLEANLIGFSGNLYGCDVAVSFVRWLRPSRAFSSKDELLRVVNGNIGWVRQNLEQGPVEVGR